MEDKKIHERKARIDLENLKLDYKLIKDKHNLPDFDELNKIFDIEELSDSQTDFLLRKLRRLILERIGSYIRFYEVILNPSNAPIFFFKIIKKLDNQDREKITNLYDLLGTLELEAIKLDLYYSEEKEVEIIKRVHNLFKDKISKETLEILNKMSSQEEDSTKSSKSYVR